MVEHVFPSENDKKVQRRAKDLLGLIDGLQRWTDSSHLSDKEKSKLHSRIHKRKKAAAGIEEVSLHPMTVGVFGHSQSGKSYLVSELTKDLGGKLEILLGKSGVRDFLKDINPEGGRESTAQVTRFTCVPINVPDEAFPVRLRLLTRTDLVKIIVNGFGHECKRVGEIDTDDYRQSVERCRMQPDESPSFLSRDDVLDLQEYISNEWPESYHYFGFLKELGFWDFLSEECIKKSFDIQIGHLSWLWGKMASLTSFCSRLAKSVRMLNTEEIWANDDCLIPRDDSILDAEVFKNRLRLDNQGRTAVKKLKETPDGSVPGAVRVKEPVSGKTSPIPKSLLWALTKEVTLQVKRDNAPEFMHYCDVLDFPGARARGAGFSPENLDPEPEQGDDQSDPLSEVFLRGKIAYLFERYIDKRDVNSLVLCCDSGKPNAKSLPPLVHKWVAQTHGISSAERQDKPVTLYVAFTKFDRILEKKGGAADPASPVRWESRLYTGFQEFYGRTGTTAENWSMQWDRRGAFTNCYWVRNPNVDQVAYVKEGNTEKYRPGYDEWLRQLLPYYMDNALVKSHFNDVRTSWSEVATPGSDGIRYLKQQLGLGLHPDQKRGMLNRELERLYSDLEGICMSYLLDEDVFEKAKKEADLRCKEMDEQEYETPVFGHVLQRLGLKERQIEGLFDEAFKRRSGHALRPGEDSRLQGGGTQPGNVAVGGVRRRRPVRVRQVPENEAPPANGDSFPQGQPMPAEAGRFADLVIKTWESTLAELENDAYLLDLTGLSAEWFRSVTDTIVKAALMEDNGRESPAVAIAKMSAGAFRGQDPGRHKKAQAFRVAQLIGNFVGFLGGPPPEVAETGGTCPAVKGYGFPGETLMAEWLKRLENLFIANAGISSASTSAIEESAALRTLLDEYKTKFWADS